MTRRCDAADPHGRGDTCRRPAGHERCHKGKRLVWDDRMSRFTTRAIAQVLHTQLDKR